MTSRRTTFTPTAPEPTTGEHWTTQAACAGMNLDDFYVGTTDQSGWEGARTGRRLEALRATCHACPVRLQCLDAAIREGDRHAFRGGTTPPERRRLARKASA